MKTFYIDNYKENILCNGEGEDRELKFVVKTHFLNNQKIVKSSFSIENSFQLIHIVTQNYV